MAEYREYISALRQCAKEHEKDKLYTGQINTSDLCSDTAKLLENDVIERSKIDKAIEEIMDIDWQKIIWKYDDVEIGFKSEVEEILKRNIGE